MEYYGENVKKLTENAVNQELRLYTDGCYLRIAVVS